MKDHLCQKETLTPKLKEKYLGVLDKFMWGGGNGTQDKNLWCEHKWRSNITRYVFYWT
jgi:hypothetical protein